MFISPFIVFLLFIPTPVYSACGGITYNMVVTGAFVDIYGGPIYTSVNYLPSILALSDGGAIMVNPYQTNYIRIIRVNSEGKPIWIYIPAGVSGIDIRQTASVEDTSVGFYFLCGVVVVGGVNKLYLLKLDLITGEYKEGFTGFPASATAATYKSCFRSTYDGSWYIAGTYTSGTPKTDFAKVTKTGLAYTALTLTGSKCTSTYAYNLITQTSAKDILVLGQSGSNFCLASYNPSTYANVNYATSTSSVPITKINYISSSSIYGYGANYILSFYSGLGKSFSMAIDSGSKDAMTNYEGTRYLVVGDSSGYAFAKLFDLVDFSACSMGQTASQTTVTYVAVDRHPTLHHYWAAALGTAGINRRLIVKLEDTTLISCSGGTFSYYNQICLPHVSPSSDCHPLCGTSCLIAHSSDACSGYSAALSDTYLYFFSTRCPTSGQDHETTSCKPVLSTNCDARCGQECFGAADNTRCTRYCSLRDPYIDTTSLLTLHQCNCVANTLYDASISKRCVTSIGCSPLCGAASCGLGANECLSCRSAPNIVATPGQYFTACTCLAGTSLVSNNCVYTSNCGGICNDNCFAVGDNNQCAGCRNDLNIVTTPSGTDVKICSCAPGTIQLYQQCVFNTGCDKSCDTYCGIQGDNTMCINCININNMVSTVNGLYKTCSCGGGMIFSSTDLKCVYTTGCHPLCDSKCTQQNSNLHCISCIFRFNVETTLLSGGLVECECIDPAIYENGLCVYNADCSPKCAGKCTVQGDNTACIDCNSPDVNMISTGAGAIKTCECAAGTIFYNNLCLYSSGCDSRCDGYCANKVDNLQCNSCNIIPHLIQTSNTPYAYCDCGDGSIYSANDNKCIYTAGCYPLCNLKCTQKASNVDCIQCINVPSIVNTVMPGGLSKCECNIGAVFENNICMYKSDCHSLCKVACFKQFDNNYCIDCIDGNNIDKVSNGIVFQCSCHPGSIQIGSLCMITSGCDPFCTSSCGIINDANTCNDCINEPNILKIANGNYYSCSCASGTSRVSNHCIFTTGCHPLCKNGCYLTNDQTKCVDCIDSMVVSKTLFANPGYSCSCSGGTTFINSMCAYTTGCDSFCSIGCTTQASSVSCLDCANILNVEKISQGGNIYSCACPSGSNLIDGNKCIFTLGCHPFCSAGCANFNSSVSCIDCANIVNLIKMPLGNNLYSCFCPNGTSLVDGNKCVFPFGCHPFCSSGCTSFNSTSSCLNCAAIDNIMKIPLGNNIYACFCPNGTYLANGNKCLYSTGCHSFCNGSCGSQNDYNKCQDCITSPMINKTINGNYYSCSCAGGKINFLNTCLYNSSLCHPLCNGLCENLNDSTSCLNCSSISNVSKQLTGGGGGGMFYTCSCAAGTSLTQNFKCEVITNCDPRCKGGCIEANNNHKCFDCLTSPNIVKTFTNNNSYCDCIEGTTLINSSCLYQLPSCSPLCNNYCFEMNNPGKCFSCINSYNGLRVYSDLLDLYNKDHYTCYQCNSSDIAFRGKCYTRQNSSNCHGLCGNTKEIACLNRGDPSLCLNGCLNDALRVNSVIVSSISTGETIYNCSCISGMQFEPSIGRCIYSSFEDCHILCGGKCTEKNNQTKCVGCLDVPFLNKLPTENKGEYNCSCQIGAPMENQLCVYTAGCHPLCGGKCISKNNYMACTSCNMNLTFGTITSSIVIPSVYKCECSSGYAFDGTSCKPILTNCHTLCKSGCIEENNEFKCLDCSSGYGVEKIISNNSLQLISYPSKIVECRCNNTTTMIAENGKCLYIKECYPTCSKCYKMNDFYSCAKCSSNVTYISILNSDNGTMNCSCQKNYTYYNNSCQPIIHNNCHPFCFNSSCITPKNSSMCLSCNLAAIPNLNQVILPTNAVSCECANNYTDDKNGNCVAIKKACSQKFCLKCSTENSAKCYECQSILGLILTSENTCKCDSNNGFKEMADFSCYKTDTPAKVAIQYGSGAAWLVEIGMISSSNTLFASEPSALGSLMWLSFTAQQELSLYSLIKIINMPAEMLEYYSGLGVFSYNIPIFPDLISIMFPLGNEGFSQRDNELEENLKLHPDIFKLMFSCSLLFVLCCLLYFIFKKAFSLTIFCLRLAGKLFLYNIGHIVSLMTFAFAGVIFCKLLSNKFEFFKAISDGLFTRVALRSLSIVYLPAVLSICVQMKYFIVKNNMFSYISVVFASIAMVIIYMLSYKKKYFTSNYNKSYIYFVARQYSFSLFHLSNPIQASLLACHEAYYQYIWDAL